MTIFLFILAILGGCFLASIAAYWFVIAFMILRANPLEYERLHRLTGNTRNALAGNVRNPLEKDNRVQTSIAFDLNRKVFVMQSSISDEALSFVFD